MKQAILVALVAAGAVLAQSGGTASNSPKAPATKTQVKKHHKGNKPAAAAKQNGASTGSGGTQQGGSKTPAPANK